MPVKTPGYLYIYLSNENDTPVEVYFDDFKVTHTKSPVVQGDDYYPFGLTFNSYRRAATKENTHNTFQDQEIIKDLDLGWVQFKWRNHMPDIGRFFNVDPLAEKFYYNSPYAFSENHVTSHVELEGLEKVFFMNSANQNKNFKRVYNVQRGTSGGKSFRSKLKSQKKYNVLYFQSSGWASGTRVTISDISSFDKLKETYPSNFSGVTSKGVETAMEGGDKEVILIGIDTDDINNENSNEAIYTLNHEEFHGERTLDGHEGKDKNANDHLEYYGEKREDSPDDSKVKSDPKYSDTRAKKQMDEIDKIVEEDKKKNN